MRTRRSKWEVAGRGAAAGVGVAAVVALMLAVAGVFSTVSPAPSDRVIAEGVAAASARGSVDKPDRVAISGLWGIAKGSRAGYRVRVKPVGAVSERSVTGSTARLSGVATLIESRGVITIRRVAIDVLVEALQSDQPKRDEAIRAIGLESERFPTVGFKLARPVMFPVRAIRNRVARVSMLGVLVVHGVRRLERISVDLALRGSTLQVAGRLSPSWARYAMKRPSVVGVVTVTGNPVLDFHLVLKRSP